MRLLWWVLFGIFSYMIIVGFFGIYDYELNSVVQIPKPTYMQSILSYFKNKTVVKPQVKYYEFPSFEIILIALGTIGFYFSSRFYREAKRYGFA